MPSIVLPDLKHPLSAKLFEYITNADRPVPTAELMALIPQQHDDKGQGPNEVLRRLLCSLSRCRIDNIGTRGANSEGLWVLSSMAIASLNAKAQAALPPAPAPEPVAPRAPAWVVTPALPPQYDVMRDPVYVPPPSMRQGGSSVRPGADDFLACPSLVNGQRQAHHTHYIAALPSGHNPDSLPL